MPNITCTRCKLTREAQAFAPFPNNLGKRYPGFATFTPCGKHDEKGKVWWMALKEEASHFKSLDEE